ncbi:hypothetical protein SAY86_015117 [Trapa natans]|uniref:Pentatricopeptide repeat-containing protein n=1 Tax=Trapa natans TaxID=22666 RepID=A0AAN7KJB6_TRANT|nr:hypothetical protein SAY86_015117 [Trapa natans]
MPIPTAPPPLPSHKLPSIISLLRACKSAAHFNQVHALILRSGLEQDHYIASHFILFSPSPSHSISFFDRILRPSIVLWNSLLKSLCVRLSCVDTLSVFSRMRRAGCPPDRHSYPLVIKSCAGELRYREGVAMHGMTVKCCLDRDVFVGTGLVDMYGKFKEIESARKVFDQMYERNVVSWTAMVVGYVNVGDMVRAKGLFDEMPVKNPTSWNAMISGFMRVSDLNAARSLFDKMPVRNVVSFTAMVDGYAKAGDMASARALFDQSPGKDVIAWSSLISGYVQNGLAHEAMNIFGQMLSENIKPDEFVLVGLMSACSQVGCSELAKWIDSYVCQSPIDLQRPHIIAALVDMNAKCGNIAKAMELFNGLPKRDLISYCSVIQGLSMHGQGILAVALFNRMLKEGIIPDEVAFTVILISCSRAGLVDEGWDIFESMQKDYSIVPSQDHYACMVDLLSRSGSLMVAYELLDKMPMEPHAGAWGALLGACKLYNDTELGEEVARRLFELEPKNAGDYVLLSNIYAAADRWLDVSLLRDQMRETGVKKLPGCSWVS